MNEQQPIHELAPMTDRPAEVLAKYYGFTSISAMADNLPENAVVMDFGAGASNLGNEIAERRPDIHWINFDLNYDRKTMRQIGKTASNVSYIRGDVLQASNLIRPNSADRVFSYGMVPHIELTDPALARQALVEMSQLLKDDGKLYVGQRFTPRLLGSTDRRAGSIVITAQELRQRGEEIIDQALGLIKIKGLTRWTQRTANKYVSKFFAQPRWAARADSIMDVKVWDKERDNFVLVRSLRGAHILSSLVTHTAKGFVRDRFRKDPRT
jgi:hypothetical protein